MARVFSTGTQSSVTVCHKKAGQVLLLTCLSREKYSYPGVPGWQPLTWVMDPTWAYSSAVITG